MKKMFPKIIITNKKARFNYFLMDRFIAGIVLTGTEIKSIRACNVSINDSYCVFSDSELFIKQMHIAQYIHGNIFNHDEYRVRKLLLNRNELLRLKNKLENGISIIPIELFINKKGYAKLEIALAKGKKSYDKRRILKENDIKRRIREELFFEK